jgi:hypothetical protein
MQLRNLHAIKKEYRLLEIDATEGLVKIPNWMASYDQILNYVMLVKNLSQPGINVTETSTSRHDTYSISQMLEKFRYNYTALYPYSPDL